MIDPIWLRVRSDGLDYDDQGNRRVPKPRIVRTCTDNPSDSYRASLSAEYGGATILTGPEMKIGHAVTGDDLLTALAGVHPDNRFLALGVCGVKILREAADLCGVDAADLGKRSAINAILANF